METVKFQRDATISVQTTTANMSNTTEVMSGQVLVQRSRLGLLSECERDSASGSCSRTVRLRIPGTWPGNEPSPRRSAPSASPSAGRPAPWRK